MISNPNVRAALAAKANKFCDQRLSLGICDDCGRYIGSLLCMDSALASEDSIVSSLTAWRQRYMKYFLTQFSANDDRTRAWLRSVVIPSYDRILFIIVASTNEVIGNFGVCNLTNSEGELDNLIRGEKGGHRKLVYFSELALLSWMFGRLNYEKAYLHVFSNNLPTINLHSSIGFKVQNVSLLKRKESPGLVEHTIDSETGVSVDFSYLEMGIEKTTFLELHPWVRKAYVDYWR
jgi:RimJ/RimL family protein N-acetyltransferase